MTKFRIIIPIGVLIMAVLIGTLIFNSIMAQKQEKLQDASISTATTVLNTLRGKADIESLVKAHGNYLSSDLPKKITDYETTLKARKETYLNLDKIYQDKYSNLFDFSDKVGAAPVVGEEGSGETAQASPKKQDAYDKDIELIDGNRQIAVSKLSFNQDGVAYVLYKNLYLQFNRKDIPETYQMMLKNPTYNYNYVTSKMLNMDGQKFTDVLFISLFDSSNKLVRVFNDGNRVTDFEVK